MLFYVVEICCKTKISSLIYTVATTAVSGGESLLENSLN